MRFSLGLVSKARRLFAPSPATEKGLNGRTPAAGEFDTGTKPVDSGFGFRSPDLGSKEETFFDSKGWLDSDCEDDFFSVNGDFTPYRGTTPNYQISTATAPPLNKFFSDSAFSDTKSEPSPTDGKKKLADLLRETLQGDQLGDEHNAINVNTQINGKPDAHKLDADQLLKLPEAGPCLSGTNSVCSGEPTPNRDAKHKKEKTAKRTQCCLPSLVQSFSFNDRKRQIMSPERCSS